MEVTAVYLVRGADKGVSATPSETGGGLDRVPRSCSSNLPARDYWKAALELLDPEQRYRLERARCFHATGTKSGSDSDEDEVEAKGVKEVQEVHDVHEWPVVLRDICQKLRAEYGAKKSTWCFRIPGRSIKIRDLIDGFVKLLDKTAKLGDLATAADPVHAGLPWAAVRALLMVTTANAQQAGALYTGLEEVVRLLNRGLAYKAHIADAYRYCEAQQLKGFEEALIALYTRIASFLASAHRVRKLNAFHKAVHAFWKPEDIIDFRGDCDKLEAAISREADLCNVFAARGLNDTLEEIRLSTGDISRYSSATNADVKEILQHCGRQKRTDVLRWVSTIPVHDHHELSRKDRTPETAEWILDTKEFAAWEEADEPLLLWLHGNPGAGKTKLISRLVDYFRSRDDVAEKPDEDLQDKPTSTSQASTDQTGLAFFYCLQTSDERRVTENILASIVKQLATQDELSLSALLRVYTQKEERGFLSTQLTITECQGLIQEMSACFTRVVVILDALDECTEGSREELMDTLKTLVNSGIPVKVLISSRPNPDIRAELEEGANRSISATDNADDILKYTRERLREFQLSKKAVRQAKSGSPLIPPDLEERIVSGIRRKSEGMFLYAKLNLDHLLNLDRRSAIENALESLPKGLVKTFDEIFHRIEASDNDLSDVALRSFQWLLSQDGDSRNYELMAAVCYDVEGDNTNVSFDVTVDTVLKACQHLVTFTPDLDPSLGVFPPEFVSGSPGSFRFIHLSVSDYCKTQRWSDKDVHSFAARTCLNHLLRWGPESEELMPPRSCGNYLSIYSQETWVFHAQKHQQAAELGAYDSTLVALIRELTGFPGRISARFRQWYSVERPWENFQAKAVARLKGDYSKGDYRKYRGPRGELMLLSLGDRNVYWPSLRIGQGDYHSLPFIAYLGLDLVFRSVSEEEIVLPLPEVEVALDPSPSYLSPWSSTAILYSIAKSSAKRPNASTCDTIWLFLALANQQWCCGEFKNWLRRRRGGNLELEEIHRCLLQTISAILTSLDVNDSDKVLAAALVITLNSRRLYRTYDEREYFLETTNTLLDKGAAVDFRPFHRPGGHLWQPPLIVAITRGVDDVVAILLERNPIVHEWDLRALLDRLAYMKQRTEQGFSAYTDDPHEIANLDLLCYRLLMDGEMQVSDSFLTELTQDNSGYHGHVFFEFAVHHGMAATARLLVELITMSQVPLVDVLHTTCLIRAAGKDFWAGREDRWPPNSQLVTVALCQELVQAGFDVNTAVPAAGPWDVETALIAAASRCNLDICKFLVSRTANVNHNASTGRFGTALIATTSFASLDIFKFLLEAGADVNLEASTGEFGTALIGACYQAREYDEDHYNIIKLLLEHGALVNTVGRCNGAMMPALTALLAPKDSRGREWFSRGTPEICRSLLSRGADANAGARVCTQLPRNADEVYVTPLMCAITNWEPGSVGVVALLLAHGADPRVEAWNKWTKHTIQPLEALEHRERYLADYDYMGQTWDWIEAVSAERPRVSEKLRLIRAQLSELEPTDLLQLDASSGDESHVGQQPSLSTHSGSALSFVPGPQSCRIFPL